MPHPQDLGHEQQDEAMQTGTVCTLPSCARRTSFSSAAVSPSCSRQSGAIDSSDVFDTRAAAREWLARAASVDPR
jgi:hypothetical protein